MGVSHAMERILVDIEYLTYYEFPAQGRNLRGFTETGFPDTATVGIELSLSLTFKKNIPV